MCIYIFIHMCVCYMIIGTSGGPTTYSKQDQLWDQTQLLGLYPERPLKPQRMEPMQPLWAACSAACLPLWREKKVLFICNLNLLCSNLCLFSHILPPRAAVRPWLHPLSNPLAVGSRQDALSRPPESSRLNPVPQPLLTSLELLGPIWGPPTQLIPDG